LKVVWNTINITQILFFGHCKVNSIYKSIPHVAMYKMVRVLLCLWRLLQKHVVRTKLYIYVFIQVRCVWYFIHVLISQCFYSSTLCLVLYTCTYISMFLFRYIVFGTLYMYLYLNVFICLNRNKNFPHFIYCIFIPKIVKMVLKLLVCHYNLSKV
jgi:hypothetical protein